MALGLGLLQELLAKLFFLRLLLGLLPGGGGGIFFLGGAWMRRCRRAILRPPMSSKTTPKCLHCNEEFHPDPRNRGRQRYCAKAGLPQGLQGGQPAPLAGQAGEPGLLPRGRKLRAGPAVALGQSRLPAQQEACPPRVCYKMSLKPQAVENEQLRPRHAASALQEILFLQPAMFVGLISVMTGHGLQEDIADERPVVPQSRRGHPAHGARESRRSQTMKTKTHPVPRTPAARAPPV